MKVYTYQLGTGTDSNIERLSHSETVYAEDIQAAAARAKEITRGRPAPGDANIVRLLEHVGDDVQLVWWRPTEAIINA